MSGRIRYGVISGGGDVRHGEEDVVRVIGRIRLSVITGGGDVRHGEEEVVRVIGRISPVTRGENVREDVRHGKRMLE